MADIRACKQYRIKISRNTRSCRSLTRLFIEASRVDKSARQPQRDMSYAAIPDLREQYHPGDELTCVVKQFDRKAGTFEISVKETVPNPFDEASLRHPVGCRRWASIAG